MFDEMNYIELSGEKFPIKCDMAVLEKVQEKYGDLAEFEGKLQNFVVEKDENGEPKKNEEGFFVGRYNYPEIGAVNDALYWMVEEGEEIETGEKRIDRKELLRKVDCSPIDLGIALHEEYVRCFERKNVRTTQKKGRQGNL